MAAPILLFALIAGAGAAALHVFWRSADKLPIGAIADLNDPGVAQAVGLLVPTAEITLADGRIRDESLGSGTCFVISPDGIALTNRHVIEMARNFDRAPLKTKIEMEQTLRIAVKFWVFLNGEQLEGNVIYVDEDDDLAVLQLPVPRPVAYFRLLDGYEPRRGEVIYALGFPGVARTPLSEQEGIDDYVRDLIKNHLGSRLRQQFKSRDLEYVQTRGSISRVTHEGPRTWVEHDARIHRGNSGGPLVTEDGRVIGINTIIVAAKGQDGSTDPILGYSLACWGAKDRILKHAPDSVWH